MSSNNIDQHGERQQQQCLVPYADPATASPAVAAALNMMPFKRNIFLLLGNSSGLFPALMGVFGSIFNGSARKLPLLDWQLIVLRISGRRKAEYEWDVNVPVARGHGMTETQIAALWEAAPVQPDDASSIWSERQRSILRLVDEHLNTTNNTDETMANLRRFLSVEEVVEVFIILGQYLLIAHITKGLRIDLDGEVPGLDDAISKLV